jgi:hypothetical protein
MPGIGPRLWNEPHAQRTRRRVSTFVIVRGVGSQASRGVEDPWLCSRGFRRCAFVVTDVVAGVPPYGVVHASSRSASRLSEREAALQKSVWNATDGPGTQAEELRWLLCRGREEGRFKAGGLLLECHLNWNSAVGSIPSLTACGAACRCPPARMRLTHIAKLNLVRMTLPALAMLRRPLLSTDSPHSN